MLLVFYGGLIIGGIWLISREPTLGAAAVALRELGATGEPFRDATTLGPFAMVLTYGVIARAERAARRARYKPQPGAIARSGRHCHGNGRVQRGRRNRTKFHATVTASCHRAAASALKIRSVDRETRCR